MCWFRPTVDGRAGWPLTVPCVKHASKAGSEGYSIVACSGSEAYPVEKFGDFRLSGARTSGAERDNDHTMDADDTDARIIERSVHAPELFGAIFDRHVIEVHRYLNRRAGPDSADSLVGDVFRIAFENRSRYLPDRECALPWLYGIAANVLRQHHRGERRRHLLVDKLGSVALREDRHCEDARRSHLRGEIATVVDVLASLPDAESEAVLLFAWEDLSYEEIAAAQDVPVGTVRSRLNRARRRMRERIDEAGQEGDEPVRRAVRR